MNRQGRALKLRALAWAGIAIILGLGACQGTNPQVSSPRPRSREAAGEHEELPERADTSNRAPIDSDGGEVEYRLCRLTIPRGAFPETVFVEIAIPDTAPRDVLPDSAYQINTDGLELMREGLLTLAYFDSDIPPGKDEEDLVIVHQVSG
ncbi:hypothetical protein IIA79_06440, partial [bacterium]|nr:hypothetical protein [bacterium]